MSKKAQEQRLTELEVAEISLVDSPANMETFTTIKSMGANKAYFISSLVEMSHVMFERVARYKAEYGLDDPQLEECYKLIAQLTEKLSAKAIEKGAAGAGIKGSNMEKQAQEKDPTQKAASAESSLEQYFTDHNVPADKQAAVKSILEGAAPAAAPAVPAPVAAPAAAPAAAAAEVAAAPAAPAADPVVAEVTKSLQAITAQLTAANAKIEGLEKLHATSKALEAGGNAGDPVSKSESFWKGVL